MSPWSTPSLRRQRIKTATGLLSDGCLSSYELPDSSNNQTSQSFFGKSTVMYIRTRLSRPLVADYGTSNKPLLEHFLNHFLITSSSQLMEELCQRTVNITSTVFANENAPFPLVCIR